MNELGRIAVAVAGLVATTILAPKPTFAQAPRLELSTDVSLDEVDSLVKGQLERAHVLVANRRWDEAIETLRQAADQHGDKVIAVATGYYVRLRDYCHRRLAALPPEGLAVYREQVDAQAKHMLELGIAERDDAPLRLLIDQFYACSFGDEALWRLGEAAFARGDYGAARGYWEQLIEMPPAVVAEEEVVALHDDPQFGKDGWALLERFYRRRSPQSAYELQAGRVTDPDLMRLARMLRAHGIAAPRQAYPGADIPPADVFARLILVSIFEGSAGWAEAGLRDFADAYPGARGRLGGREVNYVEALQSLAAESKSWRRMQPSNNWTTFAGRPDRNGIAPQRAEVGRVLWRRPLPPISVVDQEQPLRRIGEDKRALLSYHPVVVGERLFLNDGRQIHAFALTTGAPLWGTSSRIYPSGADDAPATFERWGGSRQAVGVPRFTLTVHGPRLLARVGNPVTASVGEFGGGRSAPSSIVCLDLDGEGRVAWTADPPEDRWAFEGTPLADDEHVYVSLRKGGVRPQAHVACYDIDDGRLLWRRMVCSAETIAQGQYEEITHNLLTLVGDDLYYNTNLGAVAAIDKRQGAIRWVATYPRAADVDLNQSGFHFLRDLTPCVYDRGTVFVAPSDSRHILAFDAAGGLLLWETTYAADAIHLLGVSGDYLFASGRKLWWIHAATGRIGYEWPDVSPYGYGRGALAGDQVLWPTQNALEAFAASARTSPRTIELKETRHAGGGNVVPAGDRLVIATGTELIVFDRHGGKPPTAEAASHDSAPTPNSADVDDLFQSAP